MALPVTQAHRTLTFGMYPGGMAGSDKELLAGPADNLELAHAALVELQGGITPFIVRC